MQTELVSDLLLFILRPTTLRFAGSQYQGVSRAESSRSFTVVSCLFGPLTGLDPSLQSHKDRDGGGPTEHDRDPLVTTPLRSQSERARQTRPSLLISFPPTHHQSFTYIILLHHHHHHPPSSEIRIVSVTGLPRTSFPPSSSHYS